jgi:hypothetical protein
MRRTAAGPADCQLPKLVTRVRLPLHCFRELDWCSASRKEPLTEWNGAFSASKLQILKRPSALNARESRLALGGQELISRLCPLKREFCSRCVRKPANDRDIKGGAPGGAPWLVRVNVTWEVGVSAGAIHLNSTPPPGHTCTGLL